VGWKKCAFFNRISEMMSDRMKVVIDRVSHFRWHKKPSTVDDLV